MSEYYTPPADIIAGVRARSTKINDVIQSVENGFDALPPGLDAVIAGSGILVSSNDTTIGYLNGKLVSENKVFSHTDAYVITSDDLKAIRFTENSDGGDETLTLSRQVHTNEDEVADAAWTLPAGTSGDILHVRVVENKYLRLTANGTEIFRYAAAQSAGGGYIRSDVIGTCFTLEFFNGEWLITNLIGSLLYDE